MKIAGYLINLFDHKKQREYVSEADKMISDFDRKKPTLSESQKHEVNKHKNIFSRTTKKPII
jgi:hypothetical protein